MTRRIVIVMALLVAVVSVALAVPMALLVANDQRAAFVSRLAVDTLATASKMSAEPYIDWAATAIETAERTGARVVVVSSELNLVADSDKSALDRTFDRVEINSALAGSVTSDVRYSQTLTQDLRYVAAPIVQNYGVVAAVRLSLPETQVDNEIRETQIWLLVFVGAVVIAAALVAWLLARSITAPLLGLAAIARALPDDLTLRASETDGPEEVRAVGHALNETAEKLNGIVHRTQRVAADASHHLRTPLTGVRLRLEAIEDISTESAVQDQAQAATAEVDRLTRRIDQVLALARSDAGNIDEQVVDISEIVRSRVEAATYLADERGIALNIEVNNGVQILAGPGIVARVIDELLGNSMSYAKSRITVSVGVENGLAKLEVADDGPGVSAKEYESIFERFVRGTHSVAGGSGLGLALAGRVRERGGVLALGSEVTGAGPGWVTIAERRISAGYVINAAGLYADKVAHWYGVGTDYRMLPFKGLYWYGSWAPGRLQRHVYPVPDPRNPFLGVHLTVTVDGKAKIGPTAIPALWREDYGGFAGFNAGELASIAGTYPSFFRSKDHDVAGLLRSELPKYSRKHLVNQARALVPSVAPADFKIKGRPGVRAQLFHLPTRKLEMDFVFEHGDRSTHMLNVVSPAWTSALAVAKYVVAEINS